MRQTPRLSICVPSLNRQDPFFETIRSLLASSRDDIEIIAADNSDDPSIMNARMAEFSADPRLVYLPTDGVIHSMRDNWERAYRATRGDFITVIGDDDYVEPNVVDLIDAALARNPEIDAVAWARLTYNWPEARRRQSGSWVSLVNEVHIMPKPVMIRRMFRWEGATHVPSCPFTIYHGAVSRGVMERIREGFAGRYFEHPIVDYDNSFKVLFSARALAYIDRPMSVMGVCAKSNSAAIGNTDRAREANRAFIAENGDSYENNEYLSGFPFGTMLGVASAILAAQTWFKRKYKAPVEGWEASFARACAIECGLADSREGFEDQAGRLSRAFADYEGGRHAEHFRPVWREPDGTEPFFGLMGRQLMLDEAIGGNRTPRQFYDIVSQIITDPADIVWRF